MRRRAPALLALAAAAYGLAAWAVAPGFYDGVAPQEPYRWVSPPPQFRAGNQPPLTGRGSARVAANGVVDPGGVFTGDGQAALSFVPGAFVAPADRYPVSFEIKPQAGFPDPAGLHLATNVYCITGTAPLAAGREVLVTLRFSDQLPAPADIYGYSGSGPWRKIGSTGASAPFSISTRATALGCFAGAYPAAAARTPAGPRVGGGQALPIIVAGLILIVVLAGIPLAVVRRRGTGAGPGLGPGGEGEREEGAGEPGGDQGR